MAHSRKTAAEINVAAEARAVEFGHHARIQEGGWVRVVSESFEGKWYEVTFLGHIDGLVSFLCRPHGRAAYREDHLYAASGRPGIVPCWHAAAAARSLERRGLAKYDAHGRWCATDKARALARRPALPDNPLEGLPQ